jgi:hypothetical protein
MDIVKMIDTEMVWIKKKFPWMGQACIHNLSKTNLSSSRAGELQAYLFHPLKAICPFFEAPAF